MRRRPRPRGAKVQRDATRHERVQIGPRALRGDLALPSHPAGLIVFAHDSGEDARGGQGLRLARGLQRAGLATLLFDLLTTAESHDRDKVLDVELLAERITEAIDWAGQRADLRSLPVGLIGLGVGASAAFVAAGQRVRAIGAVVTHDGRPELAGSALDLVCAPTLLLVADDDPVMLSLNRAAGARLAGEASLQALSRRPNLPSARRSDRAGRLSIAWLVGHLAHAGRRPHRRPARGVSENADKPEAAAPR